MHKLLLATLLAAPSAYATEWIDFRWESFGDFPHAAMMLPAKVNGEACYVQLDTGADGRSIPARHTGSSPAINATPARWAMPSLKRAR